MAIIDFPPVNTADENGVVAVGGDLEIDSLRLAYQRGIFPWPIDKDYPLVWFSPNPRGLLDIDQFHLSKSFIKFLKRSSYQARFNTGFPNVIAHCQQAKNRPGQVGTWITPELKEAYIKLHQAGLAYSVETYEDNQLIGGLYGVCLNNILSGESMFYLKENASKFALLALAEFMNEHRLPWLDTQMVTPVVSAMGGKEVSRENFLLRLKQAFSQPDKKIFSLLSKQMTYHFNNDQCPFV